MSRLIVLEVNELPHRVLEWWGRRNPSSELWQLAQSGTVSETVLNESLPRDLYPSQSWASVGTGVPWEDHQIFWYGDPKPPQFPFYWQAAAEAGRRVGLVGVLHSSPLAIQCHDPNFSFVIPDCFADDPATRPTDLGELQALNLRLSRQSARVATLKPSLLDARGAVGFARHGVRPATWSRLVELVANVGRGAWNKERLRVGQAFLLADVFEAQLRKHDPDLGVFFTNHIASTMHRYWAATFPEDWGTALPYSEDWRSANADELPYAMRSLDRIVARMRRLADETDREIVVVSSMGQEADLTLNANDDYQAVVRDPLAFLRTCGVSSVPDVRSSMVPQLTLGFATPEEVSQAEAALRHSLGSALAESMTTDRTLTITYHVPAGVDTVCIGDAWMTPEEAGMSVEAISDHRSGHHCPRGLLVSSRTRPWETEMDAFDVAPHLLQLLGLEPLAHHRVKTSTQLV